MERDADPWRRTIAVAVLAAIGHFYMEVANLDDMVQKSVKKPYPHFHPLWRQNGAKTAFLHR